MFNDSCDRFIASFIALALLVSAPSLVFANSNPVTLPRYDDQGKKKEDKNDSRNDKNAPSKQEREYMKIKRFSLDLVEKDPEFREEVDSKYREKQREHSEYAYYINTRDAADEHVMHTGDKLKVEDTLYDNPMVQDYLNRVGHSIVPKASKHLYAFKVTLNPIPEARSLSTGTVYVSSGLISLADNEAQLAYLLAHEVAHVEKEHWYEDVLVGEGLERYNEKQEKKRSLIGGIASLATAPVARLMGADPLNAWMASIYVSNGLPTILKLAIPNAVFSWDKQQEDEADHLALNYMLERNYDPREVPKFYANFRRVTQMDKRVGLGFLGNTERVIERTQQIDAEMMGLGKMALATGQLSIGATNLAIMMETRRASSAIIASTQPPANKQPDTGKSLDPSRDAESRAAAAQQAVNGQLASTLNAKLDAGEIIGSSAEFSAVMAQLKRDNGIRAYYYDMFQMARDNIEESLMIRSNDPLAYYYHGKILKLTARTATEKRQALDAFVRAIELDRRRVLPEARLHRALALMENKDNSETREITALLKDYVEIYRSEHGGDLPPNMDAIYDYFQEVGESVWAARPAMNVSQKIEPATTTSTPQNQPVVADPNPPQADSQNSRKRRKN